MLYKERGGKPMLGTSTPEPSVHPHCSDLVLSDRLIALAEDADRAGYTDTAEMLVNLACSVFDEAPKKPH
jgi:hypothetical protein